MALLASAERIIKSIKTQKDIPVPRSSPVLDGIRKQVNIKLEKEDKEIPYKVDKPELDGIRNSIFAEDAVLQLENDMKQYSNDAKALV